ncbi:inositol 2-dehydrogenase [Salipaludibacillus neizhouensis]|uniref:Inositol 2-dehydrogenase n=1 Tax=Salipaludibacillus neizhouensis TaxID=885475 RepID=A0A3A9K954_9BACI|nr:inositol 2-dehydrogenase [Salipaludibacillus neizhouensis]RKL67052.1 inositol 2-dehydrogenase [Salipaludibacillus neizhouensis]
MTFTIGIIGAGRIGQLHVENLSALPFVRVKSVSDIKVDHLQDWAARYQVEELTTDYHLLLQDPEIQAIFICTPTSTHAGIIKEVALSKKDIFCEKPVSFSVKETKEALEVVSKTGVKLQVGFNRRFDPDFIKLRQVVEDGGIGIPHLLKITSRDPAPPSIDYIINSGGLFMDMMIHDFDMARFMIGSEVKTVSAVGAVLIDPKIGEVGDIDTAIVTLTFANGAIGVIDNSRQAIYGYDQRVEVLGSEGMAHVENNRPSTIEISTKDRVVKDNPLYFFIERYKDAYIEEVKEFVNLCVMGKKNICDGNDGLQAELIAKAAKESLDKGHPVHLDLYESHSK